MKLNGMNLYLVQIDNGETESARLMTAPEIFRMMDMEDCYPDSLRVDIFSLGTVGEVPQECYFYGKGTDPKEPEKMRIMCDGKTLETGYGTDH